MATGDAKILAKGLNLLEELAQSANGMTAIGLAESIGIHKTSVYRYLNTLLQAGYIQTNGDGHYHLGNKISRMTIRRALLELVNEGFLVREQGRGSFVIKPRLQDRLGRLTSFTEDMNQRGLSTRAKVVLIQVVLDKEIAQKMSIPPEEELIKLQRVRSVGREPVALQTAFIRHIFCPGLVERGLDSGSLYKTLENVYGLEIEHAQQAFEAKPADEYEARMLNINVGFPVLLLERLTYLCSGEPIEYVRSAYRGDKYRFTVEMKR